MSHLIRYVNNLETLISRILLKKKMYNMFDHSHKKKEHLHKYQSKPFSKCQMLPQGQDQTMSWVWKLHCEQITISFRQ